MSSPKIKHNSNVYKKRNDDIDDNDDMYDAVDNDSDYSPSEMRRPNRNKSRLQSQNRRKMNDATNDDIGDDDDDLAVPINVNDGMNNIPRSMSSKGNSIRVSNSSVNISIDKYNNMKADCEYHKKIASQLMRSLKLYQEKITVLKQENEKLVINADCAETVTTTNDSSCRKGKRSLKGNKEYLGIEMGEKMLPSELSKYIKNYYDRITFYAHQYVSEVVFSSFSDMKSNQGWYPNSKMEKDEADDVEDRDWRGRCVQVTEFEKTVLREGSFHPLGSPLMDYIEKGKRRIVVKALYYPHCPMEESQDGEMFTSSADAMSNFIGQSAIHFLRSHFQIDKAPSAKTEESIYKFSSQSEVLMKRFESACSCCISGRKAKIKQLYFSCLGYGDIVSPASEKLGDGEGTEMKAKEMSEAYKKLYKVRCNGDRDTTFWRTSKFSEICSNTCNKDYNLSDDGVDVLFQNQSARIAFRAFRKTKIQENGDATIMSIIRMDTLMTSIVDSFKYAADGYDAIKFNSKGGTIPSDSRRSLKQLLPVAASNVLNDAMETVKNVMETEKNNTIEELKVGSPELGSEVNRLQNNYRQYTLAFKHPTNNRYYISIDANTFSKCICSWYGLVSDCYILQSESLDKQFKPFQSEHPIDVLNESDEDEEVDGDVNDYLHEMIEASSDDDDNEINGTRRGKGISKSTVLRLDELLKEDSDIQDEAGMDRSDEEIEETTGTIGSINRKMKGRNRHEVPKGIEKQGEFKNKRTINRNDEEIEETTGININMKDRNRREVPKGIEKQGESEKKRTMNRNDAEIGQVNERVVRRRSNRKRTSSPKVLVNQNEELK